MVLPWLAALAVSQVASNMSSQNQSQAQPQFNSTEMLKSYKRLYTDFKKLSTTEKAYSDIPSQMESILRTLSDNKKYYDSDYPMMLDNVKNDAGDAVKHVQNMGQPAKMTSTDVYNLMQQEGINPEEGITGGGPGTVLGNYRTLSGLGNIDEVQNQINKYKEWQRQQSSYATGEQARIANREAMGKPEPPREQLIQQMSTPEGQAQVQALTDKYQSGERIYQPDTNVATGTQGQGTQGQATPGEVSGGQPNDLMAKINSIIEQLMSTPAEASAQEKSAIESDWANRWKETQGLIKSEAVKQTGGVGMGGLDSSGYLGKLAQAKTQGDTEVTKTLADLGRYYNQLKLQNLGTALGSLQSLYGQQQQTGLNQQQMSQQAEQFAKNYGLQQQQLAGQQGLSQQEMALQQKQSQESAAQWAKQFGLSQQQNQWNQQQNLINRQNELSDWNKQSTLAKELSAMQPQATQAPEYTYWLNPVSNILGNYLGSKSQSSNTPYLDLIDNSQKKWYEV